MSEPTHFTKEDVSSTIETTTSVGYFMGVLMFAMADTIASFTSSVTLIVIGVLVAFSLTARLAENIAEDDVDKLWTEFTAEIRHQRRIVRREENNE